MVFICLGIYIIFAIIWYMPLYKKQPDDGSQLKKKELIVSLITGFIPAFVVSVLFQCALSWILKIFGLPSNTTAAEIIMNIVGYAIGEEAVKYIFANKLLKKYGYKSVYNTALLFGAVGAGFGLIESTLIIIRSQNIIFSALRGIVSLHVFLQLWMGLHLGFAMKVKETDMVNARRHTVLAFVVPIFIHAVQDVSGTLGGLFINELPEWQYLGLAIMLISIALDIFFIIKTLTSVKRSNCSD